MLHMQPAVVGIHVPGLGDAVSEIGFSSPVFNQSPVHVQRTARRTVYIYNIVSIDVKEVHPIAQCPVQQALRERKLVTHQSFRFQVRVLGREHVHLPYRRVAETFACHCFDFSVLGQVERKPALRNPFPARPAVVVEADAGIERKPFPKILPEVYVSPNLVQMMVGARLVLSGFYVMVP